MAEVGAADDEAVVENINFAVLETDNLVPLGRQQPRQPASQLRRLVEGEPAPVLALGGRGGRCVVVEAGEEAGGRVPVPGDARAAAPVQQHAHAEAGARGEAGGYRVAQPPLALLHAPVEGGHDDPLPAGGRPGDENFKRIFAKIKVSQSPITEKDCKTSNFAKVRIKLYLVTSSW